MKKVATIAKDVEATDGQLFCREGELGQDLYIVVEGRVVVRRGGVHVAELGPGEVVGEMAVLDRQPRSADVLAAGRVRLLRVRGDELLALLADHPALALGIIRVLTGRLRETGAKQDHVDRLIRAYRVRGHIEADLNPLEPPNRAFEELDPAHYGFEGADLDAVFSTATIPGASAMTLRNIIAHLRNTYCRSIGVQFMHIDDLEVKEWLQERMERTENQRGLSREEQLRILTKLTDAENFEQFIHKKFLGAKRFSLEGAETLIPLLDMAIEEAGAHGIKEIVIGMAHRGRLNVLANILEKSPAEIFREFDDADSLSMSGSGDVKYHLGHSFDRMTGSGQPVHLSLTFNPSHLECVGPVVLGRVRAKQDRFEDVDRTKGLAIIIHGDSAFAGQGVVQEMLNMSGLDGYRTGGSLHIIVNNQIGFTTEPTESRSTQYATDVAKMLQIPIFHVNGEHPEPVAQVIKLATEFHSRFQQDVIIDMYCYRQYGHNEGDEPAFTQPLLYEKIRKRKSVREGYLESLYTLGGVTPDEADEIARQRRQRLEDELTRARSPGYKGENYNINRQLWERHVNTEAKSVPTAVDRERLVAHLQALSRVPASFRPHRKLARVLSDRAAMAEGDKPLDWAAGEALAFASLLAEGARIRLSGQDCQRGTFSHRHAVLHDTKTNELFVPLSAIADGQARFEVLNSPLSETGVLGFEYGYSLDTPDGLVIWEAQFGDFVNVAQVIIDQFISSGEDKWNRLSGLVMLLPHGFEGQGPEHSSARLERFLMLAAEDNFQVCNLTTPGQLFHALRRQVVRPSRKPLVIMSPKSLLRHPKAVSNLDELCDGEFRPVIQEESDKVDPAAVKRILLTSGKLFYELDAAREERGAFENAVLRLEQYYPFEEAALQSAIERYPASAPIVWVQEEPRNMGAWPFLSLTNGDRLLERQLVVVSRDPSSSPATGSPGAHRREQAELIDQALSGAV